MGIMFGTNAVATTDSWSKNLMSSLPDANFQGRNYLFRNEFSKIIFPALS